MRCILPYLNVRAAPVCTTAASPKQAPRVATSHEVQRRPHVSEHPVCSSASSKTSAKAHGHRGALHKSHMVLQAQAHPSNARGWSEARQSTARTRSWARRGAATIERAPASPSAAQSAKWGPCAVAAGKSSCYLLNGPHSLPRMRGVCCSGGGAPGHEEQ